MIIMLLALREATIRKAHYYIENSYITHSIMYVQCTVHHKVHVHVYAHSFLCCNVYDLKYVKVSLAPNPPTFIDDLAREHPTLKISFAPLSPEKKFIPIVST